MAGSKMKNITIKGIQRAMLIINLIAIIFVAGVIYYTTGRICDNFSARDFLDTVSAFPRNPLYTMILATGLYLLLAVSMDMQNLFEDRVVSGHNYWIYLAADFLLALAIIFVLDFNYNSVLFIVFSGLMMHLKGQRERYVMIFLAMFSYMLTNAQILSGVMKLYSVSDYFAFYDAGSQQRLIIIYNLLNSVSIILFIIFCMVLVYEQRGTILEINKLNAKISRTNSDLQKAYQQLEDYAKMTEHMGQMQERNRLAREIHDTLGHTLTGLAVGLDAVVATLGKVPEDTTKDQLTKLSDMSRNGLLEVRRSVSELKPDETERLPLKQAITKMITDMRQVSDTEIFFDYEAKALNFDDDEESAIYRVVQEGITNAIRHGKAKKVYITLKQEYGLVRMIIKDDGIGCDQVKEGFGTKHMLERIQMLNGEVKFTSKSGEGFTIEAIVPIRWGEDYD